jgi:hypothetical protein
MLLTFDAENPEHYANLTKTVRHNYKAMEGFRRVRRWTTEAARGHLYDTKDNLVNMRREPVNMLDQLLQVLVRSFVQNNPRARVISRTDSKAAQIFQEHLNKAIVEIKLKDTLRACLRESILGFVGIAYCGAENSDDGASFCDPVSLPDFVVDMGHGTFDRADFMGHRLSMRLGELLDDPLYDQEMVKKLKGRSSTASQLEDSQDRSRRRRDNENEPSLYTWVDIWSIYVKPAGVTVYWSEQSGVDKFLRIAPIDAPEFGPYALLGFDQVEDCPMPNSPGAKMLDMHSFVAGQYGGIFAKEDQAADFYTYEGGSEEDARRIRDAEEGGLYAVQNNNAVKRRTRPGTNPQALGTAVHGRLLFDEMSGNIRRYGGVASNANTATEARIDQSNTSRLIQDMQSQVIDFTKLILQNLAWFEYTHPTRMRLVQRQIGNTGMSVPEWWSPAMREGDFVEHEIDIIPDSMEHRTNGQQLEHLVRAVQGIVVPLMQMPSDRPVILKGPEFLRKYSELDNLPELADVADYAADESFVTRPATSGGAGGGAPANQSAGTPGGQGGSPDEAIMARMFSAGGAPQEDE